MAYALLMQCYAFPFCCDYPLSPIHRAHHTNMHIDTDSPSSARILSKFMVLEDQVGQKRGKDERNIQGDTEKDGYGSEGARRRDRGQMLWNLNWVWTTVPSLYTVWQRYISQTNQLEVGLNFKPGDQSSSLLNWVCSGVLFLEEAHRSSSIHEFNSHLLFIKLCVISSFTSFAKMFSCIIQKPRPRVN